MSAIARALRLLLLSGAALVRARGLYPVRAALQTGNLAVSTTHTLYYEVHGKKDGPTALFLHGGPGAGCAQRHAGFFDPDYWRVVLFDQRGCGKSTPKGCLVENDTPNLVSDCEALRTHLDVPQWQLVLGGSWGTTLALAYAVAYPQAVASIVLRAVCLMRTKEVLWLFGDRGVARLLPRGWHDYAAHCDKQKAKALRGRDVVVEAEDDEEQRYLRWYARALSGEDGDDRMKGAAGAWSRWEMSVFGLSSRMTPNSVRPAEEEACALPADVKVLPPYLKQQQKKEKTLGAKGTWIWEPDAQRWSCDGAALPADGVRYALCEEGFAQHAACALSMRSALPMPQREGVPLSADTKVTPAGQQQQQPPAAAAAKAAAAKAAAAKADQGPAAPPSPPSPAPKQASGGWIPAQARLTSHYSDRRAFFASDDDLLSRVEAIRHIPCIAVQGGNDLVCPPVTAFELHEAWPEMELRIVPGSGHSHYDGGIQDELLRATDALRDDTNRER